MRNSLTTFLATKFNFKLSVQYDATCKPKEDAHCILGINYQLS